MHKRGPTTFAHLYFPGFQRTTEIPTDNERGDADDKEHHCKDYEHLPREKLRLRNVICHLNRPAPLPLHEEFLQVLREFFEALLAQVLGGLLADAGAEAEVVHLGVVEGV